MAYIFMDESGCLGFDFSKSKTSQCFIVTFVACLEKRPLERLIKKQFAAMTPQQRKRWKGNALHSNQSNHATRKALLSGLAKYDDVVIMVIRLNKKRVYAQLRDEKHVLYNYIVNILLDRIVRKKLIDTTGTVHLIASRRETNRFLNENFKSYLETKGAAQLPKLTGEIKNAHAGKRVADCRFCQLGNVQKVRAC